MADPAILFGNSVAAARAWILGRVPGLPVSSTEPNPRPAAFVVLTYAGGNQLSPVHESARLIVDTWGPTKAQAHDNAQLVRAHLSAMRNDTVAGVLVYSAKPSGGLVDLPDPDSGTPRYRQNFELTVRGTQI